MTPVVLSMNPVTIEAYAYGNCLFSYSVPYNWLMTVRDFLEQAFVGPQSPTQMDPFLYTLEDYGYSQDPDYPGYLGYVLESLGLTSATTYTNGQPDYWEVYLNLGSVGSPYVLTDSGIDTTFPNPGAIVKLQYGNSGQDVDLPILSPRQKAIHARRIARASAKQAPDT